MVIEITQNLSDIFIRGKDCIKYAKRYLKEKNPIYKLTGLYLPSNADQVSLLYTGIYFFLKARISLLAIEITCLAYVGRRYVEP